MQRFIYLLLVGFVISCGTVYQPQKMRYYDYPVNGRNGSADASITKLIRPYGDSIHKMMDIQIGELGEDLEKKQPNGSLGMVLADAMKEMAELRFETKVDAAFINYGGVRIPAVAKGPVTIGTVYEIMPFDNLVVLQKINGRVFKQFLDLIAKKGGWPVSGVQFTIANKKAEHILIHNVLLDPDGMYTIANSDYVANGGDEAEMLRPVAKINKNILMRDLFIEFFKKRKTNGQPVLAPKEERIQQN